MDKKKTKLKTVSKTKSKVNPKLKQKAKAKTKLKPKAKAGAKLKVKAKPNAGLKLNAKSKSKVSVKLQAIKVKKETVAVGRKVVASEVALGVVIALAVIFGIIFFFTAENISTISDQPLKIELPIQEKPGKTDEQTFCTMDAKQCSDGSFVGRVAPRCEFAPCPDEK
jgi:hypothetical protein